VLFMAAHWLSIRVTLLGGRGETWWPPPGRVFVVGPGQTFAQLARAIDDAFARWDHSHPSRFTLPDGTAVGSEEAELTPDTAVLSVVSTGAEFRYVFGNEWVHRCAVEHEYVDPLKVDGAAVTRPTPYFGWGLIPDQHGRRWEDDDGSAPLPQMGAHPDPMLSDRWPAIDAPQPPVDLGELRAATARRDVDGIMKALRGRDLGPVLQFAGAALLLALGDPAGKAQESAADVVRELRSRNWDGDAELADDLAAMLRAEPAPGREIEVDLDAVESLLEGSEFDQEGGYLDLTTGDVLSVGQTDAAYVGEDAAIDVDEEPERWLDVPHRFGRDAWEDMAAFAYLLPDRSLGGRLTEAISGRGAFRRFRDEIDDAGLMDRWRVFSEERRVGRARAWLASQGLRARPRRW